MYTYLPLTQWSRTHLENLVVHKPIKKFLALLKTRMVITCLYTQIRNLPQSRIRLI